MQKHEQAHLALSDIQLIIALYIIRRTVAAREASLPTAAIEKGWLSGRVIGRSFRKYCQAHNYLDGPQQTDELRAIMAALASAGVLIPISAVEQWDVLRIMPELNPTWYRLIDAAAIGLDHSGEVVSPLPLKARGKTIVFEVEGVPHTVELDRRGRPVESSIRQAVIVAAPMGAAT